MAIPQQITGALSENLLTLLSQSDEFGKLVANTVDPQLFEGEMRVMAERIIQYWRQQGCAPKLHTADLFDDILSDPRNRRAPMYRRTLSAMLQLNEGINAQYVLGQLKTFTRMQKLKDAILRSAEILNSPVETTIPQVEEILHDILRAREFMFDPGISMMDYDVVVEHLQSHYSEFGTGIPAFDHHNIVPNRGALFMLLGASGTGKTWGMVHLGRQALMLGKKVLHITPELSDAETLLRYYMMYWAVPKGYKKNVGFDVVAEEDSEGVGVLRRAILKLDTDKRLVEITHGKLKAPPFDFQIPRLRDELRKRVTTARHDFRNMRIKRVAPRSLSVDELEAYLDGLESTENFIPDMLIVDSAYLLKVDTRQDYRIGLGRSYERLRGIGVDRNIAVVASHQLSREAAESRRARMTHIAEDWSIVQTADIVVTHSSTKAEQQFGLARLYADKVRSDKSDVSVLITQNYSIGQYCLMSHPLRAEVQNMLDRLDQPAGQNDTAGGRDDD